jgi:hypothetical protein
LNFQPPRPVITFSRYLVKTGFVNELLAETSLTTKCIQYLVLPCITEDLPPQGVLHFALLRHYVFQDYAVGKWSSHFTALLEKATAAKDKEQEQEAPSGPPAEQHNQALLDHALDQLRDALYNFTVKYQNAFSGTSEEKVTLGAWDQFESTEDTLDFYWSLYAVKAHIQQHLKKTYEIRNKVSIEALATALDRNRSFLENPAQDPFNIELKADERKTLEDTYGTRRYKCSRLDCDFFYSGFMDRKSRQKHVDQHERPFRCDVAECPGELGFISNHDLQKHKKTAHSHTGDGGATFEPLESAATTETTAKWPCPHCPKRFTRGFHMRNHIRTHSNERPFSCTVCGKSFVRDYDRKRHEKTVHTRK